MQHFHDVATEESLNYFTGLTESCNIGSFFFEGDMMEEYNEVVLNMCRRTFFKVRKAAWNEK